MSLLPSVADRLSTLAQIAAQSTMPAEARAAAADRAAAAAATRNAWVATPANRPAELDLWRDLYDIATPPPLRD
jgi:hypothetical protein